MPGQNPKEKQMTGEQKQAKLDEVSEILKKQGF